MKEAEGKGGDAEAEGSDGGSQTPRTARALPLDVRRRLGPPSPPPPPPPAPHAALENLLGVAEAAFNVSLSFRVLSRLAHSTLGRGDARYLARGAR